MSARLSKVERYLPVIRRTGEIEFGMYNVFWILRNNPDKVKLIILASNTPPGLLDKLNKILMDIGRPVKVVRSRRTNLELGNLCGRPHSVSIVAILDFGSTPIDERDVEAEEVTYV